MIPLDFAGLAKEVVRLINNFIEGEPMHLRQAKAIAWFWMWWPLIKLFLKKEHEEQVMKIMEGTQNVGQ